MPFVTERLWQALPETIREGPALILARWPEAELTWLDEKSEADMGLMINLIRSIRNIRTEYNVAPSKRVSALISTGEEARFLESQRAILCTLAKLHPDYLII